MKQALITPFYGKAQGTSSKTIVGGGSGMSGGVAIHTHANLSDLSRIKFDADTYLLCDDAKIKAGFADEAAHAAEATHADEATHAAEADNADKWDGKHFDDYLDQSVKRDADVEHHSVKASAFKTKNYAPGGFAGAGTMVDGEKIEVDNLVVRKSMTVTELLASKIKAVIGKTVQTCASGKIQSVVDGGSYYKCFIETDGGTLPITFSNDDQVRCQRFDGRNVNYYWRRCTSVGTDYINLSKSDCDTYSGTPAADDEIVTMGNRTNPARQNFILTDGPALSIDLFKGCNTYDITPFFKGRFGDLSDKGIADLGLVINAGRFSNVVIGGGSSGLENLAEWSAKQTQINNAQAAAATALQSANAANSSISDQRNYIDGAFKDGVVSEAEAAAIDKLNKQINSEFDRAIADYNSVYTNTYLVGAAKSDLLNSKINLVAAKDILQVSINAAIADGKTTAAEKADVDSKFASYKNAFTDYQSKLSDAGKAVQVELDRLAGVKVDGLQVGGVNLLLSTKDYYTFPSVGSEYTYKAYIIAKQLEQGKTYKFRCKVEFIYSSASALSILLYNADTTSTGGSAQAIISNGYAEGEIVVYNAANTYQLLVYNGIAGDTSWNIFKISEVKLEVGNKNTDWTPAPEDIDAAVADAKQAGLNAQNSANAANNSIASQRDYIDGAFKDGVVSEAEAAAIDKLNKQINSEFDRAIVDYNAVYTNTYLTGAAKTDLLNSKINLVAAKDALQSSINTAIADGKTTAAEKADVDSKFASYKNAFTDYQSKLSNAGKAVQVELDRLAGVKVDAVQIGGRNLLKGTSKTTIGTGSLSWRMWELSERLVAGVTYIVGGVFTNTSPDGKIGLNNNDYNTSFIYIPINEPFVATAEMNLKTHFAIANQSASGNVTVTSLKIEKGNRSTDWTPAPEDVDTELNAAKIAAATAQADATLAKARTEGRTVIDGGIVETNIVTLGTGGIAGISGIPTDPSNNPLPSRWTGGTYAQAVAKLATIIEWFNGDAKYGDFWIDSSGSVCIKDSAGVNRVVMTRSDITTLAAIANSTQNTNVSNLEDYYTQIGTKTFYFANNITVNNNNSTVTIQTAIQAQVAPENPNQGQGMARVDLYLNNISSGIDVLIASATARAMNSADTTSVGVNKQMVLAAGTYRLKAVYTHSNYSYLCNFYSEVSASTTTVFFDGSTQRTEIGKNGIGIIGNALNFSSRSIEGGVFKVVEKTTGVYDVPGVLAAGNIASSGVNANTYGAKVSSNTATKGGVGQYYVPHNVGSAAFTAIVTPVTDSVTCRVVLKNSTQFVVYCRNASNTLVDASFEYLLVGRNS